MKRLALPAGASALMMIVTPTFAQMSPPAGSGVSAGPAKPKIPGQNLNGMRIYIRAGLKTHNVGEHDYPQFLADWSKLLTERGAVVDGSLHGPDADELARTDVLVIYKGDAGFMDADDRSALDAFVRRGGGIVSLHDAMCGPDPKEMSGYVGGAKMHGQVNYTLGTDMTYSVTDRASPIMKGVSDMTLYDEAFYKMTWAAKPEIKVLATTKVPDTPSSRTGGGVGQVVPQVWTYEHVPPGGKSARAFVWMQGHTYTNFSKPEVQGMLLRGIAWAAHRPADELVDYKAPSRP